MQLLFNILIVFSFLKPSGFDALGYSTINSAFNVARIVFAGYIFLEYFRKSNRISRPIVVILGFFSIAAVSTLLSEGDFFRISILAISMISLFMYIELMSVKNVHLMILSFFIVYMILILFNYVWMINIGGFVIDVENSRPDLFAYGKEATVTILSSVNGVASYIFPSIVFAVLFMLTTKKKKLFSWLLIALCFLSELFLWSATALSGVFLSLVYLFCIYGRDPIERRFPIKMFLFFVVALSMGITFFHIQYLFSFIIENVLHKDISMTGRIPYWKFCIQKFFTPSPVLGSGWGTTTDNCFVQVLCSTGVLGFSYFLFMIKKFLVFGKVHNPNSLERFLLAMFAIEIIMFASESWVQFYGFYVTLALLANARTIQENIYGLNKSVNVDFYKKG